IIEILGPTMNWALGLGPARPGSGPALPLLCPFLWHSTPAVIYSGYHVIVSLVHVTSILPTETLELSIYSPSNSTTSSPLPCNSTLCGPTRGCLARCGKNQTGYFLESGGGINGIFGLGMDSISVPSILANKGVTANSFSMCFAAEGSSGRIGFGDKGSPLQKTTPFNLQKSNPTYNITVTKIAVGNNVTDLRFTANFNSGTAITRLTDPAYSFITNNFNSRITEKPYHYSFDFVLHYCYALSANQDSYTTPNLTFTMKGGSQFNVTVPTIQFEEDDGSVFCLALIKSEGINVIGQNFMTGYRIVFDREEMLLGWKESDCELFSSLSFCFSSFTSYDSISSSAQPPPKRNSTRSRAAEQSPPPLAPPPSGVARLSSVTSGLMAVMLAVLFHNFIALSS
ncbi:hypothetical protein MIMGU_mgv1a024952mg, partial [Erythranthe guttata]